MLRHSPLLSALLAVLLLAPGCTTISQLAALRQVDFDLGGVQNGLVAGVDLDRVAQTRSLGVTDVARLTAAAATGSVPLRFTLNVDAENPAENATPAQLVKLDWTLFLNDTQTVSGIYNDDRLIQPGATTVLPIAMELDLVDFFGRNVGDLSNLIVNLAGGDGGPSDIRLEAQPTIQTSLGPIRYPGTISITFPVGS